MTKAYTCLAGGFLLFASTLGNNVLGQAINWEAAPIAYSESKPVENPVAKLQSRMEADPELLTKNKEDKEYLQRLLEALEIPVSSQVLVFSKTSLQDPHIGPKTPRAIYFNDSVHLGYVQHGLIEIAVADPQFGAAFYTIDPKGERPTITREVNRCASCHAGGRTIGVPGFLVRSVFASSTGEPVIRAGSFLTLDSSPLEKRWGGWYVTGTHGNQAHLGNYLLQADRRPKEIDNSAGFNLLTLEDRVDITPYLSPHSDIVALMVLEHQTEVLNYLTRAVFADRIAQHRLTEHRNAEAEPKSQEADALLSSALTPLVDHLLLVDQHKLTDAVVGTSSFKSDFEKLGPYNKSGDSIRKLNLTQSLFEFPWSPLLFSKHFSQLSPTLQHLIAYQIAERLPEIATPDELEAFYDAAPSWLHNQRVRARK